MIMIRGPKYGRLPMAPKRGYDDYMPKICETIFNDNDYGSKIQTPNHDQTLLILINNDMVKAIMIDDTE